MDQIHSEISQIEIKIRKRINSFDSKQDNDRLKFGSIYEHISNLWIKRKQLIDNLNEQINKIEQNDLAKLNKLIEFNNNKLNNAKFLKEFSILVDELERIHALLNECVQHDRDKNYDQFVIKIRETDNLIRDLQGKLQEKNSYLFNNKMYDVFSEEMNLILKKMHLDRDNLNKKVNYDLKHIWDQNLVLRREDEEKLTLYFDCKLRNNTNQLSEYLNALDKSYLLEHLIKNLGTQLIDRIINTILNKENTLEDFEILSIDKFDTLKIQFLNQQTDLFNGELIVQCISTLIRFLQMIFESNKSVLKYLNSTFVQVFKLLNGNVLDQLSLSNYTSFIERIEELQNEAIKAGCLNEESRLDFSNSIDFNFVNKLCDRFLIKARKVVKKDLLPVKEVGANYLVENRLNTDPDIQQTLYSFPKCKVSCSVEEFIDVLKEIIDELKNDSTENRKDLYLTSRKLCELFIDVSAIKHGKKLDSSISQACIFHNNCFYVAHELVKLSNDVIYTEEYFEEVIEKEADKEDKEVKKDLNFALNDESNEPQENDEEDGWEVEDVELNLDNLNLDNEEIDNQENEEEGSKETATKDLKFINVSLNLVDFVPLLRDVGSEQLLKQLRKQKKFILDILQEPRTMQNLSTDQSNYRGTDYSNHPFQKAISQILDRIFSLREEIRDILPNSVSNRIVCTLLDTLIQEVFHKILNLDDIPESNCNILLSALDFLENYLNETEELQKLVVVLSEHHKLLEMKFVLKANLQEITDRWDNGDGPLTLAFTPDQLKHMIRALFQNTERRSALLSKIK